MYPISDPHVQRQHVADRQEALRRAARDSRLRREHRRARRRERAGPDR